MMRLEQIKNLLIARQNPNCFYYTDMMFPSCNFRVLNSSLIVSMIHLCARFSSVVLCGVPN